jgi:hypothetical protein
MNQMARIFFWAGAVILAAIPVLVGVADTPAKIVQLFSLASYRSVARDLMFLAIAVLSIGFSDVLDSVLLGAKHRWLNPVSLVVTVGIFIQLVLYAFWVGRVGHPATMDEMMPIVYILSLSGFSALGARLISIVAMPEPKQR